jgi:eukaryotic-like serine/threonine-protein kinase
MRGTLKVRIRMKASDNLPTGFERMPPASSPTSEEGFASSLTRKSEKLGAARLQAMVGTKLDGRYTIESVLGEGGMGVVYLARHSVIDKQVAIKALRSDLVQDQEIMTRFMNEAQAASRIGSDHIIDISDFGTLPGGGAYFVMEYLKGQGLADVIESAVRLPHRRALHIVKQVAEGLGAAHEAGIVHRDLKPDNIMLIERGHDPDFVKVLDFGIAKVNTAPSTLTRAGSVFGTPQYMSPEQAAGLPVDHRADVYSLGIILYEMLKGEPPFYDDNVMNTLSHQMFRPPPPLRTDETSDIPEALEAIVKKCLAKKADTRYASMRELNADIAAFELGEEPAAAGELARDKHRFSDAPQSFPSAPRSIAVTARTLPRIAQRKYTAWGIGAGVLFSGILAGGIAMITAKSAESKGSSEQAFPLPLTSPPLAAAPVAPLTKRVRLHFEPKSAAITMDDRKTVIPTEGQGIATLEVQEGASFTVFVNASGYKEASVLVQSLNEDVTVPSLEKLKPPAVAPPAGQRSAPLATAEKLMPEALPKCPDGRWASKEGRCCKSKALFGKCQEL